jgi:hypothetical protein
MPPAQILLVATRLAPAKCRCIIPAPMKPDRDESTATFRLPRRRCARPAAALLPLFLAVSGTVLAGCKGSGTGTPKVKRDWTAYPAVATVSGATEIYAVGDLHGDVGVTARLLSGVGLISTSTPFHWTGGTKVVVVLGDVIDKGTSALPIIDLLSTLETEARAAGGQLIVTMGNHEAEFLADPTDSKSLVFQTELMTRGLDPERIAAGDTKYGSWLLTRPVAALVDGWFFCHAGNTENRSIDQITAKYQAVVEDHLAGSGRAGFFDPAITGKDSLLEAQSWWQGSSTPSTGVIDANLAALPAQHLVFGHEPGDVSFTDDPQGDRKKGELVQRYDGRIFMIDVGMSFAVGYSDGTLLQIIKGSPDRTSILYATGTPAYLWP